MAQITTVKVTESEASLVLRVYLQSDGSGELVYAPLLLPSDLNPPRLNNRPAFRIQSLWYGLVWFDVSFFAGTLQPVPLWTLARDCDSHVCFEQFGGLIDQNVYTTPPPDDNGILTISTNGFVLGSQGSLVLALKKTNAP